MSRKNRIPKKIGLVTCTMKKKRDPCRARELYSESGSFTCHLTFAQAEYDHVYIVSARHGLIFLDQVLAPYECFLGSFSHVERQAWASFVAACLRHEGMRAGDEVWLHTDTLYRDYLTSALNPYGVAVCWVDFDSLPKAFGSGKNKKSWTMADDRIAKLEKR